MRQPVPFRVREFPSGTVQPGFSQRPRPRNGLRGGSSLLGPSVPFRSLDLCSSQRTRPGNRRTFHLGGRGQTGSLPVPSVRLFFIPEAQARESPDIPFRDQTFPSGSGSSDPGPLIPVSLNDSGPGTDRRPSVHYQCRALTSGTVSLGFPPTAPFPEQAFPSGSGTSLPGPFIPVPFSALGPEASGKRRPARRPGKRPSPAAGDAG